MITHYDDLRAALEWCRDQYKPRFWAPDWVRADIDADYNRDSMSIHEVS
ncbi:MAG: hypothetical protein ABEN55_03910 [Bradymonadaceae bacterium]